MKKTIRIILKVLFILYIIVMIALAAIQLFYPRLEHPYKEVVAIYVYNYHEESYLEVAVPEEDKKNIYSMIKHAWLDVDLMAGDNCGCDGPGIIISYIDGTSECWGCTEKNHARYIKYDSYKYGTTSASFQSKKILRIIEKYTYNE